MQLHNLCIHKHFYRNSLAKKACLIFALAFSEFIGAHNCIYVYYIYDEKREQAHTKTATTNYVYMCMCVCSHIAFSQIELYIHTHVPGMCNHESAC